MSYPYVSDNELAEGDGFGDYDDDDDYDDPQDCDEAPDYRVTRLLMESRYREISSDQIEAVLASVFPDMAAEDVEDFLRDAGRAFRQVGQTIARRAPSIFSGALQGAVTGSAGGPGGAIGGALLGGAGGALSTASRPSQAQTPPAPGSAQPAPSPKQGPGGGSAGAISQLISLLAQPQTFLALLAAALGRAGRRTVPAGQTAVPIAAILSALGTIATRAAEELAVESAGEGMPEYLRNVEGDYAIDPANPDARASHVLAVLTQVNEAFLWNAEDDEYDYDDDDDQ